MSYRVISTMTVTRNVLLKTMHSKLNIDVCDEYGDMLPMDKETINEAIQYLIDDMVEPNYICVIPYDYSSLYELHATFQIYVRINPMVTKVDINKLKLKNPKKADKFNSIFPYLS